MDISHALILGIVEGLTEFLPISSTGHLILASHLLGLPETEFLKSFEISIQLGAIMSVVALYWRRLFLDTEVMKRIALAFLPTAVIGLTVYKSIKAMLGSEAIVLWTLLLGGIVIIVFEWLHTEKEHAFEDVVKLPYRTALYIGLFQSIAMIPGVSRSGATILGGLFLGIKRKAIVEFSFLLAVPTMAAATGLDLLKNAEAFSLDQFGVLVVGFVTAFAVAIISIRFLLRFVQTQTFISFGVYRIALALIFFAFVL
ncbi:MAG: undecaprenyl-diphosphate phosphatase [Candidatus Moranbacteria bacterium]|nr:undecaprenyl-diphosphate phosphatase [Candidatus Moranbacteria bacterium]